MQMWRRGKARFSTPQGSVCATAPPAPCPQWPSFNGALASLSPHDTRAAVEAGGLGDATEAAASAQYLSIINTVFSLMGATLGTFAMSSLVGGRLNMVHVQVGASRTRARATGSVCVCVWGGG